MLSYNLFFKYFIFLFQFLNIIQTVIIYLCIFKPIPYDLISN